MNKAELKAALHVLGVEYPEDATNADLEALLKAAQAAADELDPVGPATDEGDSEEPQDPEDTDPAAVDSSEAAQAAADELVHCVMLSGGPAGRIIVNRIAVGINEPGRIPRTDFDRLKAQYKLEEIQE